MNHRKSPRTLLLHIYLRTSHTNLHILMLNLQAHVSWSVYIFVTNHPNIRECICMYMCIWAYMCTHINKHTFWLLLLLSPHKKESVALLEALMAHAHKQVDPGGSKWIQSSLQLFGMTTVSFNSPLPPISLLIPFSLPFLSCCQMHAWWCVCVYVVGGVMMKWCVMWVDTFNLKFTVVCVSLCVCICVRVHMERRQMGGAQRTKA